MLEVNPQLNPVHPLRLSALCYLQNDQPINLLHRFYEKFRTDRISNNRGILRTRRNGALGRRFYRLRSSLDSRLGLPFSQQNNNVVVYLADLVIGYRSCPEIQNDLRAVTGVGNSDLQGGILLQSRDPRLLRHTGGRDAYY
jgi:hypothetical protein